MNDSQETDWYVSKVNWLVSHGRDDLIDEIADEFERREPSGREAFWSRDVARWPGQAAS